MSTVEGGKAMLSSLCGMVVGWWNYQLYVLIVKKEGKRCFELLTGGRRERSGRKGKEDNRAPVRINI